MKYLVQVVYVNEETPEGALQERLNDFAKAHPQYGVSFMYTTTTPSCLRTRYITHIVIWRIEP